MSFRTHLRHPWAYKSGNIAMTSSQFEIKWPTINREVLSECRCMLIDWCGLSKSTSLCYFENPLQFDRFTCCMRRQNRVRCRWTVLHGRVIEANNFKYNNGSSEQSYWPYQVKALKGFLIFILLVHRCMQTTYSNNRWGTLGPGSLSLNT